LEQLDLSDTKITDENLAALRGLESLKTIYVGRTKITNKGLGIIRTNCPNVVIKADVEMSGWGGEQNLATGR
ncbi:MAG: hypothetical protein KDB03_28205, partial [Planctomycetales bacterium]|nr:hypothetical protein [Planctomycetales bacterium]